MKIQCSCGTKYSFDITPEMTRTPVRFVCQSCGLDSSNFVNDLIRREMASAAPAGVPIIPESAQAPAEAQPAGTTRIRIQSTKPAEPPSSDAVTLQMCAKHPGQTITHQCLVCQKPICPKCMELFGYVCSPLCIGKAEAQGIEIPVYKGKKSVIESRQWRKVGLVAGAITAVLAGFLGLWFWYAWFGSMPKPVFSVRFAEPAYSGESVLCGKDQLVFLHGGTLERHDIKAKKAIWSRELIDRKHIADEVAERRKEMEAAKDRMSGRNPDAAELIKIPPSAELTELVKRAEAAALQLHVSVQSIWVSAPDKLVRYDWDSGKTLQEIPLSASSGGLITRRDELLLMGTAGPGQQVITHISLASGESRVEKIGEPLRQMATAASSKKSARGTKMAGSGGQETAGLPLGVPGSDAGKTLDPGRVAEQAQSLSLPAKIALPATLSSELHQERIFAEAMDEPNSRQRNEPESDHEPADRFSFIPSEYGYVQFSVRLLEERFVTRKAMKEPPAKSVMEGNFTVAQSGEAANEILNEMQRSRGGDTVTEDESRYQVVVRRPEVKEAADWTGEVTGRPSLFPLKSVNIVAGGKKLIVLDKMNKKLWQSTLSYKVVGSPGLVDEEKAPSGRGPCVERGDTLYIFDEAVLTAFELRTGNVRWRLPSVGTVSLFFDDEGMMYVNTTTASPESIKYSRQIDIAQTTGAVVLKLDPRTGKTLWAAAPGGFITYVSGKFVYTLSAHQEDETADSRFKTGLEIPSFVMIQRINPGNGHVMWPYREPRAPLDVQFNGNSIQLVFKNEVEVLTFLSL
jgi:hypothetical protein